MTHDDIRLEYGHWGINAWISLGRNGRIVILATEPYPVSCQGPVSMPEIRERVAATVMAHARAEYARQLPNGFG